MHARASVKGRGQIVTHRKSLRRRGRGRQRAQPAGAAVLGHRPGDAVRPRSSDAAGNAYAQAFGAIEVIALWLLLAVLGLMAGVKGTMPVPAVFAAVLLVPASGFVTMAALELLSRPEVTPFLWPLVIPAAIRRWWWPSASGRCCRRCAPSSRAPVAAGIVWGACRAAVRRDRAARANAPATPTTKFAAGARKIRRGFRQAAGRRAAVGLGAVPGYARRDAVGRGHRPHPSSSSVGRATPKSMLDRGDFPLALSRTLRSHSDAGAVRQGARRCCAGRSSRWCSRAQTANPTPTSPSR